MADLDETIESVARGPKSVSVDGTKVDAQSIDDLVKADQHLAGKIAIEKPNRGIRFNKLVPPGAS
jgi:hypothetical protein